MSLNLKRKIVLLCSAATLGFVLCQPGIVRARGVPASEGILNFGKVNDVLYRGAQPDEAGIEKLSRLGIKTIINLRMAEDAWKPEEAKAISHGILYTNVPFHGMGRPTDDQVKQVLGLIETLPGPVF